MTLFIERRRKKIEDEGFLIFIIFEGVKKMTKEMRGVVGYICVVK